MGRVTVEIAPPVVERDAGSGDRNPGAEGAIEALDHTDHIPHWVSNDKAGRVAVWTSPSTKWLRLLRIEEHPTGFGVHLVNEPFHRHVLLSRIRQPAISIRVGQLCDLGEQGEMLDRVHRKAPQLER